MSVPGFKLPLHGSLTAPILIGGVPRRLAVLNGTFCAAVVLGLHVLWALPLFVAVHVVAALLAKRDPYIFEVVVRHLRHRTHYGT